MTEDEARKLVDSLLPVDAWITFYDAIAPELESIAVNAVPSEYAEMAKDIARSRAAELVGMRIDENGNLYPNPDAEWAISDTTREQLVGLIQNTEPTELPQAIRDSLAFSPYRARMIAQTETHFIQTSTAYNYAQESGRTYKQSVLSNTHGQDDQCLIGDTSVRTGTIRSTYERIYSGPVVEINLADGNKLTGTPNHPILTDSGWKRLGELIEGTRVISGELSKIPRSICDYFEQVPTAIENKVRTFDGQIFRLKARGVEFHNDGESGEVYTKRTNRFFKLPISEQTSDWPFGIGSRFPILRRFRHFAFEVMPILVGRKFPFITHCSMCGRYQFFSPQSLGPSHNNSLTFGRDPSFIPQLNHPISQTRSSNTKPQSGLTQRQTRFIQFDSFFRYLRHPQTPLQSLFFSGYLRGLDAISNMHSLFTQPSYNRVEINLELSRNFIRRPQFFFIKPRSLFSAIFRSFGSSVTITKIRRRSYSGPVYNANTVHGLILANNIVTSNCDDNADDGPIPIDEPFMSGDMFSPFHPFCACDIEYLDEKEAAARGLTIQKGLDDDLCSGFIKPKTKLKAFNPDQERDEHGKWTSGGGDLVNSNEDRTAYVNSLAQKYLPDNKPVRVEEIAYREGTDILANAGRDSIDINSNKWTPEFFAQHEKEWDGLSVDPSPQGILTHETGHLLFARIANTGKSEFKQAEALATQYYNSDKLMPSAYAGENSHEWAAEAFVAFHEGRISESVDSAKNKEGLAHATEFWNKLLAIPKTKKADTIDTSTGLNYYDQTSATVPRRHKFIRQRSGKWYVYSHTGRKLGGPYDTKDEAVTRLGQIEHFKEESKKAFNPDQERDEHGKWTSGGSEIQEHEYPLPREEAVKRGFLFHGMGRTAFEELKNSKGFEGGGFSDEPQQAYGPKFIAVNTKDLPAPTWTQEHNIQYSLHEPWGDLVPIRTESDVKYYGNQLYALPLDHIYEADSAGNIIGPLIPKAEKAFNPDQERDSHGRWTSSGDSGIVRADLHQPVVAKEALQAASETGRAQMIDWLDGGKGLAAQLGYRIETARPPELVPNEEYEKPGGMYFQGPSKDFSTGGRAEDKVKSDYNGDWSRLTDTVRATIAVDSKEELDNVLGKIKESGAVVREKDRIENPLNSGYRDMNLNVRLPNGIIGEVQLHLKPMLEAKNTEGHKLYEDYRKIYVEHGANEDEWPQEVHDRLNELVTKQKEIYDAAWNRAMNKILKIDKPSDMTSDLMTYYEGDNAIFRTLPHHIGVQEIWDGKQWIKYTGDGLKPWAEGTKIKETELPIAARSGA